MLEKSKNSLLNLVENLQRQMINFEELYNAKNKDIKEKEQEAQEHKMMLDEATEELEDLKGIQKEKQQLAKRVKTLEKEKVTLEEQQMGKIRLISGLEKEKEALAKQVWPLTRFFSLYFTLESGLFAWRSN